jgi:hypothetical protein
MVTVQQHRQTPPYYITAKNMFTQNAIAHYIIHHNKKLIMTHEQYEINALRIASAMKLSASPNI